MATLALVVCIITAAATEPPPAERTVLVLPLEAKTGVSRQSAELLTVVLVAEARKIPGYKFLTLKELEGVVSVDQVKMLMGCDSLSCAAELAGALNTDELIAGTVGMAGRSSYVLSLSRVAARTASPLGSSTRRMVGTEESVVFDNLPAMVAELFPASGVVVKPIEPAAAPERALRPPRNALVLGGLAGLAGGVTVLLVSVTLGGLFAVIRAADLAADPSGRTHVFTRTQAIGANVTLVVAAMLFPLAVLGGVAGAALLGGGLMLP